MKIKSLSSKKKAMLAAVSCALVGVVAVGAYFVVGAVKKPSVVYGHPSYVIDVDDPREVAGFVDYVFVGRVEKQTKVKYAYVSTYETDKGEKTSGIPYTGYEITVLENLKGDLRLNETIPFWKQGGVTMDGKHTQMIYGDFLPEEGSICMFYATAQEDGSLHIFGANGNVKLSEENLAQKAPQAVLDSIGKSPLYQELAEACKNEIPFKEERFTAHEDFLESKRS
ncbi:MAG: hypothetical protein LBC83_02840 [Oscillospiraceae bacterium]|jgi:hypothetical protein|nr:hypothetical protein [Oscillospiraceae bacterium]